MKKVSIIIPVYNVERYLARCIDSCINQTYNNVEIICVNDGSTDGSLNILEHYKILDSRIQIINKENGGLSSARNAGVAASVGDYILFVDSDDFISCDAVEHIVRNAERNSSDVVIFDYFYAHVDRSMRKILTIIEWNDKRYENKSFNLSNVDKSAYLLIPVAAWCKFYRTEYLKENNITFFEGVIFEDVDYNAKVLSKAERITYVNEPLYHYYVGRSDQIMAKNDESLFDVISVYLSAEKTLKQSKSFEKYKASFYLLVMRDLLMKLRIIKPELQEILYNKYKEMNLDIDYEIYEKGNYNQVEKTYASLFKILNQSENYNDFLSVWDLENKDGK